MADLEGLRSMIPIRLNWWFVRGFLFCVLTNETRLARRGSNAPPCPCRWVQAIVGGAPVFLNAICVVLQLDCHAVVGGWACSSEPIKCCSVALIVAHH